MARLSFVDEAEFEAAIERGDIPGDVSSLSLGSRIWAHRPDLLAGITEYFGTLSRTSMLEPRLRELVRLRVAFHNQCRTCMARRSSEAIADGMTEEIVCQLARPAEAADLTARERAALAYADLLAADHLSITDGTYDDLRLEFTEPEIIELGALIAWCIGMGRLTHSWDVIDDLPERYHAPGEVLAPWTTAPVGKEWTPVGVGSPQA